MKNNKFNKEWTPFYVGCALALIGGIMIVIAISLRTPIYKSAYNNCKDSQWAGIATNEVVDCRCFARCWERVYKTGMQNYTDMLDTTDVCVPRCVRI